MKKIGYLLIILLMLGTVLPAYGVEVAQTPSGIALNEIEAVVGEFVSNNQGTTPGLAIAVVSDGEIAFMEGYGYADIADENLVNPQETIFEWGSVSKLVTWTSIMQLVEEGKIDLDTDIREYVPQEFHVHMDYSQVITIRDLMNHSAGFGDYAFDIISFTPPGMSLEDAIIKTRPEQYYEVGTASAYSNYSTLLAGYIVEQVSGIPFAEYEEEYIFEPLQMKQTFNLVDEQNPLIAQLAIGYMPDGKGGFSPGESSYCVPVPAGAVNGTVEDLAKFMIAVIESDQRDGLFTQEKTGKEMLSPSYDVMGKMRGTYHGFMEFGGKELTLGHGGNTAYFSSSFAFAPEKEFGVCILTNATSEMTMTYGLMELLMGEKENIEVMPEEEWPSSEELEGFYVPMQRQEGSFVDFVKYIMMYKLEAIDARQVKLIYGPYEAEYQQVSPYHYEITSTNASMLQMAYPEFNVQLDGNKVQQIMVGNGMDLSALPMNRTVSILLMSVLVIFLGLILLSGLLVRRFIRKLTFKEQNPDLSVDGKKLERIMTGLMIVGLIALLNNLGCGIYMVSKTFISFDVFRPYLLLNYGLLAIAIGLGISGIRMMTKFYLSKRNKVMCMAIIGLVGAIFAVFINWNFFIF